MYMVAFMYPNAPGATFNFEHFVNVHLTLGLGLTEKHLKLKPVKIVVYSPTSGAGGTLAPYITMSSVYFATREEAETFSGLFGVEEAARRLSADFPNYTPGPPDVMLAEVVELTDMQGFVDRFARLEQAGEI